MAQWLGVLLVPAEFSLSIQVWWHTTAGNPRYRGPDALFWPPWAPEDTEHTQALVCTHSHTHIYTQINAFLKVTSFLNIEMKTDINIARFRMVEKNP